MGEKVNNIEQIEGVILTPAKIIEVNGGDVLHGLKGNDPGYFGFGEAYFSTVHLGVVKAWKRHREMTLNLVVPAGNIKFVVFDDRDESKSKGKFGEVILSIENYYRLTLPPKLWMGFQGLSNMTNMLLNVANIPHSKDEADRKDIMEIDYDWEKI